MDLWKEKLELQRKLERYGELLRSFGPTGETIREYITELERQLRVLDE